MARNNHACPHTTLLGQVALQVRDVSEPLPLALPHYGGNIYIYAAIVMGGVWMFSTVPLLLAFVIVFVSPVAGCGHDVRHAAACVAQPWAFACKRARAQQRHQWCGQPDVCASSIHHTSRIHVCRRSMYSAIGACPCLSTGTCASTGAGEALQATAWRPAR